MTNIDVLNKEIIDKINSVSNLKSLEQIRITTLGKKGSISELMKGLGSLSVEERKEMGSKLNKLKSDIAQAIAHQKHVLDEEILNQKLLTEKVDVTLPVRPTPTQIGKIHPISQVMDELIAIFSDMGFSVAEGPDIESDYYNFTALNFSESHPARQTMDTFYIKEKDEVKRKEQERTGANPDKVLRTHTSPVQIRTMLKEKPPIRIIAPGRTFRCDSDQTHTPMFHQVEGLVIDKQTNLCNLRWVLEEFCKAFFEVENIKMRFRPSYFPFTEPSAEVDIGYEKHGNDIHIGEGNKWLEILGSGMVHPQVLRNVGLDPDIYQGFAFGMGIDRIAMLKYGMSDLRSFFDADLRWLKHYGFSVLNIPTLQGGLSQ